MARIPEERPEVAELIRRLEGSRGQLEGHVRQLKRALDVPSRVRHSVASHPLAWFGGSLGAGLIVSKLLRRKKTKEQKRKSFFGFLFASLLTLLKPALKGIVLSEIQRRLKVHTDPGKHTKETQLPLPNNPEPGSNS
ncbi:MAG: hypothetical protein AAGI48_03055 [Verrucomicrobiota bacterium]